jgi:hypothetical protein
MAHLCHPNLIFVTVRQQLKRFFNTLSNIGADLFLFFAHLSAVVLLNNGKTIGFFCTYYLYIQEKSVIQIIDEGQIFNVELAVIGFPE